MSFPRNFPSLLTGLLLAGYSVLFSLEIPLNVKESEGYARRSEHVTVGIPVPRGAVTGLEKLSVCGPDGSPVPAQFEQSMSWPDGSAKWLLVDFIADCPASGAARYVFSDKDQKPGYLPTLKVTESDESVTVETGPMRCVLSRGGFDLFGSVYLDHDRNGSFSESELVTAAEQVPGINLVDQYGQEVSSRWGPWVQPFILAPPAQRNQIPFSLHRRRIDLSLEYLSPVQIQRYPRVHSRGRKRGGPLLLQTNRGKVGCAALRCASHRVIPRLKSE